MREELLNGLTEEQISKIKARKNQEEVLKISKEEGIELTNEQLEAVSGGSCNGSIPAWCPPCAAKYDCEVITYDRYSGLLNVNVQTVAMNSGLNSLILRYFNILLRHFLDFKK